MKRPAPQVRGVAVIYRFDCVHLKIIPRNSASSRRDKSPEVFTLRDLVDFPFFFFFFLGTFTFVCADLKGTMSQILAFL